MTLKEQALHLARRWVRKWLRYTLSHEVQELAARDLAHDLEHWPPVPKPLPAPPPRPEPPPLRDVRDGQAPVAATRRCAHPGFGAKVDVNRLVDTGKFSADVTVWCAECGRPFRFIGCDAGLSWEKPTVSVDGLELRAPIEPEDEPRLAPRSTFQAPPPPLKHRNES